MNTKILVVDVKYDVEKYGILGFNEFYEQIVASELEEDEEEFEIINVDDSGERVIIEYEIL